MLEFLDGSMDSSVQQQPIPGVLDLSMKKIANIRSELAFAKNDPKRFSHQFQNGNISSQQMQFNNNPLSSIPNDLLPPPPKPQNDTSSEPKTFPSIPKFPKMVDGRRICPECQLTFRDSDKARRHFLNLHTQVSFKCVLCDVKIKRRDRLKTHLMKSHSLMVNEAQDIASSAVVTY
ncbi:uncharacterized protein LOC142337768 isoform X2 [Convolutriloba macropyga]|uniref:uncharacterized protein LOC142337768 isoform X2 n=1 Tax=Convolutriloba macropyga TaxID=536237 RepID=UPI003F529082